MLPYAGRHVGQLVTSSSSRDAHFLYVGERLAGEHPPTSQRSRPGSVPSLPVGLPKAVMLQVQTSPFPRLRNGVCNQPQTHTLYHPPRYNYSRNCSNTRQKDPVDPAVHSLPDLQPTLSMFPETFRNVLIPIWTSRSQCGTHPRLTRPLSCGFYIALSLLVYAELQYPSHLTRLLRPGNECGRLLAAWKRENVCIISNDTILDLRF
jgi:hypothetical protein